MFQRGPAAISAIRFLMETNDMRRANWHLRRGTERIILWTGRIILIGPVITLALVMHLMTAENGPLVAYSFGVVVTYFQIVLFVLLFQAVENRWKIYIEVGAALDTEEKELIAAMAKAMEEKEENP